MHNHHGEYMILPSLDVTTVPQLRPKLRLPGLLRELGDHLLWIIAIYALVNLVTVRFVVDGASMEPGFQTGQFLIVSRLDYLFGEPARGDVVVFHFPNSPDKDYIKRVIGVPGDVVEIRDVEVLVNGVAVTEPYTNGLCTPPRCGEGRWELGPDQYFFMGDNRNHSSDSRTFGPVGRQYIVGRVIFRYWPLDKLAPIHGWDYDADT